MIMVLIYSLDENDYDDGYGFDLLSRRQQIRLFNDEMFWLTVSKTANRSMVTVLIYSLDDNDYDYGFDLVSRRPYK